MNKNRELTETEKQEHDLRIKELNYHSEKWHRVKRFENLPYEYFDQMGV